MCVALKNKLETVNETRNREQWRHAFYDKCLTILMILQVGLWDFGLERFWREFSADTLHKVNCKDQYFHWTQHQTWTDIDMITTDDSRVFCGFCHS